MTSTDLGVRCNLMCTNLPLQKDCHRTLLGGQIFLEIRTKIPFPLPGPSPEWSMVQCSSVHSASKVQRVSTNTAMWTQFRWSQALISSNRPEDSPPQFQCQMVKRFLAEWRVLQSCQSRLNAAEGNGLRRVGAVHPICSSSNELYALPLYQAKPWVSERW